MFPPPKRSNCTLRAPGSHEKACPGRCNNPWPTSSAPSRLTPSMPPLGAPWRCPIRIFLKASTKRRWRACQAGSAAARRALELNPENADAQLALIFMTPYFRNWSAKEADLRRVVADHPRHWLAHGRLGVLLYQLGRLSEGIEQHRMALEIEPMLPTAYSFIIRNLSALGKVQEAEAIADKARER